ncbi:hypothetical protein CBER1_08114 [Cercospora berteroae]|uniref:Uncharacterized protein n=1 Tax=Cercospora berteroae TaxID=357750 RepID=A0A2S6BTC0_9PEZI|nr:hypothetical protein CBER1_08114 [Cercospora berteroae]
MGTPRYHHQIDPFHENTSESPTAYQGAGAIDLTPTLRIENNRFEEVHLPQDPNKQPQPAREGLKSRLLSSLSSAQPAAAALSRSGSVLHSRAKSWAAAYNQTTPERSPSPNKNKFVDNLFAGESGRVRLGVPTSPIKEKEDTEFVMEYQPGFTERPGRPRLRQQPTNATTSTTATANSANSASNSSRKVSWFGRKASTPAPQPVKVEDEMLSININTALFPHGPADPLSPQAFNDLLLNATNLIQRMQIAYKEKVEYLASIQPEIDAQKEEVEEAQTRSAHLKMQLEDTARIAKEQRDVNEELILKLSEEKMKVQQLQEERAKSIRIVRRETEIPEEDEDPNRTIKRSSRGSASDSGFESDADTASLFSSGVETPASQYASRPPTLDHRIDPRYIPARGSVLSQQSTAFSRNEGVAWATVEKLRNENSDLKAQVVSLQQGYDGVLEFVETLSETK